MTAPPSLSLLVLRSTDPDRAVRFYEAIGLRFQEEQHGAGPIHFAAEWNGLVLEIYPESKRRPAESSSRLGFAVDDFDAAISRLVDTGSPQGSIDESTGFATYDDPDGRTVEIRAR